MTDYKNIRGKKIKFFTSDLSNAQGEGQIFYSDTDSEFKVGVITEAWSSASPTNNTRGFIGSLGTQTANLGFGGYLSTNTPTNVTEEYNGSSSRWSRKSNRRTCIWWRCKTSRVY
jgi:hypothetical protein